MGNNLSALESENKKLEQTIALAKNQLDQARRDNAENRSAILSAKQELRENTSHSISNLWTSDGFEALVELSQYTNPIINKIADYEATEKRIVQLERLIQSPYFARIDFKFEGEDSFEKIYIGRFSLRKEDAYEIYVYDWRTPIASVFYRFLMGPAFYDAPGGRITGEVNLKRHYEISKGVLEYFFDADLQITDEILRKLLAQNTSSQMKAIVETIQKEQDVVIRDMENDLMMVQGVAGSGKTSIALHRAAYLMYQGLSSKLSANNILIISPNSLFEQYISNVLPELGEEHVVSAVFEEIMAVALPNKPIQSRNQFLENLITSSQYRDQMKGSIEFKTSPQFLVILHRFMDDLPPSLTKKESQELPEIKVKKLINLYGELFQDKEYFYRLAKDVSLPKDIEVILDFTQKNLNSSLLPYDDAIVLTYLSLKTNEINGYKNIKQVVIDEAQDYYPLHYEIFNLLFPRSQFTILGDINQTLEKQENLSLYQHITQILNKKKASLVTMNKSFRCTNEILAYSSKFVEQDPGIKSFNRRGETPEIYALADPESLHNQIVSEIQYCLEKGFQSIGLVCKTERNARSLFTYLKNKMDVQLVKNEHTTDLHGVFIIPVYMSKGLEFDAVLICDASAENYHREEDKKLLYIASTRALHRLNLFCQGEASPLL